MTEAQKSRRLKELRKQLHQVSARRASYRGDPEGLRDHQEHVDAIRAEIRKLER